MKSVPKIVLHVPSLHWRSTIEFHLRQRLEHVKLIQLLNLQDCIRESNQSPDAVIVELNQQTLIADCTAIRGTVFSSTTFFGLSDDNLRDWMPLIRASGVSDVCFQMATVNRFVNRIERRIKRTQLMAEMKQGDPRALENLIHDQLPW